MFWKKKSAIECPSYLKKHFVEYKINRKKHFSSFYQIVAKKAAPLATSLTQFWRILAGVIPTSTGDDAEVFGTLPQDWTRPPDREVRFLTPPIWQPGWVTNLIPPLLRTLFFLRLLDLTFICEPILQWFILRIKNVEGLDSKTTFFAK